MFDFLKQILELLYLTLLCTIMSILLFWIHKIDFFSRIKKIYQDISLSPIFKIFVQNKENNINPQFLQGFDQFKLK
jgi:hypothetical protein